MPPEPNTVFEGNERYRCIRPIGEGGMGLVYEVEDRLRGTRIALKTLRQVGPLELYLFKNEFRALADVSHPNLIGLYELSSTGDIPWFTMELLEGAVDLVRFVRGPEDLSGQTSLFSHGSLDLDATLPPPAAQQGEGQTLAASGASAEAKPTPIPQAAIPTLRRVLGQLADALCALHGAGKLHRDVKPKNVLVTEDERVVLLDFGLVASLGGVARAQPGIIAGSIPYMSPEQSVGAELSPASDWYAFGAILYELLTGRPPFIGDQSSVLMAKRNGEVRPPAERVEGIPGDLDDLCVDLLNLDPAKRPTGSEICETLGRSDILVAKPKAAFIGRVRELETLKQAFQELRGGKPLTLHLRGPSGMGKSALVEHALSELPPDALVLASRCYERDSLPFKAIDPLVDHLTQWLCEQPRALAAALAPRHIRALARLFPVIDRVPAFAGATERGALLPDPSEQRRRALTALRELLARVADNNLLVVHLDDLQWADPDSHVALREILREPDPPVMGLLLSYRQGYSQVERELGALAADAPTIDIGPLSPVEATALAGNHLPDRDLVADVVREAGGNPFYTIELARRAAQSGAPVPLEVYVADRIAELPEEALRLLQAVALAAVPTQRAVALHSSGASLAAITALQAGRLIRSEGPSDTDRLQCDHDRIREAIVEAMGSDDITACHVHLAEALIAADGSNERISNHLLGAGDLTRAADYARRAADEAATNLAFHREAALVQRLLALEGAGPDRAALLERQGRLLSWLGRGDAAAAALLDAVKAGADPALEGEAARVLTFTGNLEEGSALARKVMARVGAPIPQSRFITLFSAALRRLWTRLRPLKVHIDPLPELSPQTQARLESMGGLSISLVTSDMESAWYLMSRYIPEGLASGDARHAVHALTLEQFVCHAEPGGPRRADQAYALAIKLLEALQDDELEARLEFFRMISLLQLGELKKANQALERAIEPFERAPQLSLERGWFQMFRVAFLSIRQGPGACLKAYYEVIAEARERGDLALESHTRLDASVLPGLVADDPAAALRNVDEAVELWCGVNDLQVFSATTSRLRILNYQGEAEAAVNLLAQETPRVKATGALQTGANRTVWWMTQARVYFAAWEQGLRPRGLEEVQRQAALLLKAGPWGRIWGTTWMGVLQHVRGDAAACETLRDAARLGDEEDAPALAWGARWVEGCISGDATMREEAEAWMGRTGVVAPARYLESWLPRLEGRETSICRIN